MHIAKVRAGPPQPKPPKPRRSAMTPGGGREYVLWALPANTNTGSESGVPSKYADYPVTSTSVEQLEASWPNIDVNAVLQDIRDWAASVPQTALPTAKAWPRVITCWMRRVEDKRSQAR